MALTAVVVGLLPAYAGAAPAAAPGPTAGAPTGDRGSWTVTPSADGAWEVAWTSPEPLPVASDRPTVVATDADPVVAVGPPTVASDGRTVLATVVADAPPDPADLDVVLSGRSLVSPEPIPTTPAAQRWTEPPRDLLPTDPGDPGDLPVVSSDYELPPLRLQGLPEDVEMVGHVVEPAPEAASPYHPLVLFLHGRHAYCYEPATGALGFDWPCRPQEEPVPSHLGYHYLQRLLASQGFVTVSIAANGVNAQDHRLADAGAAARATLVRAHLDRWASWADDEHVVDLDRVVLVGHSRGGEGVARAALEIPLTAPYRVAGQVLLAPTAFSRQTTPYVPTATVLPSCDGDVVDLQGQVVTDASRNLIADDTSLKSSVLAVGANHNFFNTEWTPRLATAPADDDWQLRRGACARGAGTRLTSAEQRRVARAYVAGAVRLFARDEEALAPMLDGSAVRVASTGDAVVLSHALGGGREVRAPGPDASPAPAGGAETQLCRGVTPYDDRPRLCGRVAADPQRTPHWPEHRSLLPSWPALELSWEQPGATGGLLLDEPLDLSDATRLDLRTVVDPRRGDVALSVRVADGSGGSATATPVGGGLLPALPVGPRWYATYWAQTLRVDLEELDGVDLSDVREVALVAGSGDGRVWVLDVSGGDAALPAVPARRAALIDLGRATADEGDDGDAVAAVPFTVTGSLTAPALFRVSGFGGDEAPRTVRVEIPAGTRQGTVAWPYRGDDRHGRRTRVSLVAHALRGAMVRDHLGRLVIRDDDPAPDVRVTTPSPVVPEGRRARFRVTLSAPVEVEVGVFLVLREGRPGSRPLHVADLPARWRRTWLYCPDGVRGATPLHRCDLGAYASLPAGERRVTLRVPTARDRLVEPREALTVTVRAVGGVDASQRLRVTVRDR